MTDHQMYFCWTSATVGHWLNFGHWGYFCQCYIFFMLVYSLMVCIKAKPGAGNLQFIRAPPPPESRESIVLPVTQGISLFVSLYHHNYYTKLYNRTKTVQSSFSYLRYLNINNIDCLCLIP